MTMLGAKFYRYNTSPAQPPYIWLEEHTVIRETSKGVWLDNWGKHKFVLLGDGKRYAYPTKEKARESFIKRQVRREAILRGQLEMVRDALKYAHEDKWPETEPVFSVFDDFNLTEPQS